MINNLLKVVGAANDNNGVADAPASSSSTAYPYSTADDNDDDGNNSNSNNLASTIGGLLNTIQETFQLDGRGVASGAHLLVPGGVGGGTTSGGISGGVGIGFGRSAAGRSKNNARNGRCYYADVTAERRRREAAAAVGVPQLLSGMGVGVGVMDSNAGNSQINHQSREGKSSIVNIRPIMITNGVYQGRKIVPDINHLYDVVNDKEAHENYDTLMEIISNTTSAADVNNNNANDVERLSDCSGGSNHVDGVGSDGGRRGANSTRGNSLERKLIWARFKEEEVVDRMLSQFPEFGTNLPTPYTVMDEEDNNDCDDEEYDINNSVLRNNAKSSEATNSITSVSNKNIGVSGNDNTYPISPTIRSLTDDASDIIGRLFFGVSNSGGNNSVQSNVGGNSVVNNAEGLSGRWNVRAVGGDEFQRTSSFGSASTLSTMTGSAATLRAVAPVVGGVLHVEKQKDGDRNPSEVASEGGKIDANKNVSNDKADVGYSSDWDPDEIDLWMKKSAPQTLPPTKLELGGGSQLQCNERPPAAEDNWASRRRLYRERHRKRRDWNSLKVSHPGLYPSAVAERLASVGVRDTLSTPTIDFPHQPQQRVSRNSLMPTVKKEIESHQDSRRYNGDEGVSGGAIFVDNEKQHWMPDNICKQCYSCEAPFTLIRRKHHCRLCGMIFCSVCSSYFVQISSSGTNTADGSTGIVSKGLPSSNKNNGSNGSQGTIRTCQLCYDHLSERGLGVIIRGRKLDDVNSRLQRPSSSEIITQTVDTSITSRTPTASPSMRKDSKQVEPEMIEINPSELSGQFAGFRSVEGSHTGEFHALSITKKRLEEERRKREERERTDSEEAARLARSEEETKAAELRSAGNASSFRLKSQLGSVRHMWNGSLIKNASEAEDLEKIESGDDANAFAITLKSNVECDSAAATENTTSSSASPPDLPIEDIISATRKLKTSSGVEGEIFDQGQRNAKTSAKIHLGMVAADYLEKITRELLQSEAPLLLDEIKTACIGSSSPLVEQKIIDLWVNTIMSLATRCCSVEPDVKKGDFLDIRPYCKVKTITGGSVENSAFLSGIVFHKNVSHKKMARVIMNAKIIIMSGGIEYTRTENRIASLDTLIASEERYMEILVSKIFKVNPDILIVGKSVCRKAQELLLRANIVLIQYVKPTLLARIARQTGATVVSSVDHVVNSSILGRCRRFRLVSFRDNDVWVDNKASNEFIPSDQKSVSALLSQDIPNHERQAALAAQKLGECVFDGMEAVTLGLAKRGVVQTYSMIEGCAKELGCTVILRGASRPALKMVKRLFRFLVNCSYNMKLETSYILERCCRLPPTYEIPPTPCCSSSLCVDFGSPPNNRKARPWNGGKNDSTQRSLSGKITPLDHQAILITSVWMTEKTQCCPAEVKGICYYSTQDVSLGQFLRDSCFNLSLKCQNPSCKKSVIDHSLSFIHNDGMINISVERMDNPIPTSSLQNPQQKDSSSISGSKSETALDYEPIATWTYCTKCSQVVTPLIYLSKQTWQWSFGKFLEVYFYNRDGIINAPGHNCSCRMQTSSQLFFGCGNLAARFTYEKISPYSVFCRRHLPFDESFHRAHALQDLDHISSTSTTLFLKYDKQIDAITRETRELFGSAVNKPEHLQAVLSELNLVSAEVDNASKVLQEKIASVMAKFAKVDASKRIESNEALLHNFPWYSRRYIFLLASAWNERLSAAGVALTAMKKIQNSGNSGRGDSAIAPAVVGDAGTDDVVEGMKRIRVLQEAYARNYNVTKMTMPRSGEVSLFEGNILPDGRVATWEEEAEIDDEEFYSDPENDIDFEDDVDADVLASRNRVYSHHTQTSSKSSTSRQHPKISSGGKRPSERHDELATASDQNPGPNPLGFANNYDSNSQLESHGKAKVTAGGAVKSALNRFFNRGGNKEDPYIVDLGVFGQGRPRLQPGVGGLVIPVFDDQPSTIISHSLASAEYDIQFKHFLGSIAQYESPRSDIERRMLGRNKSHIKHTFRDFDEKGQQLCKFVCTTFWSVQFDAVRQAFMNPQTSNKDTSGSDGAHGSTKSSGHNKLDVEKSYIRSLALSKSWAASGGKSGAAFSRTTDDRFVIKSISRTELQMFLDCAPAYFEYLNKAFFHGLPTVLCKIVGVYQIGYHNRVTGRRTMEQVAVMQNIFYGRKISKIFDLKGSLRGRFTRQATLNKEKRSKKKSSQYRRSKSDATSDSDSFSSGDEDDDDSLSTSSGGMEKDDSDKKENSDKGSPIPTLLDGDFLEFTSGRPLPLTDRAKAVFHMSILNDTLFLSIINVLDYSILVGIDEEKKELVVGIIDFMRQYDIMKQMERVGKSLPMVVGSEAPTIIQPPLYKARFTNAMERYFMTVPSKWTTV